MNAKRNLQDLINIKHTEPSASTMNKLFQKILLKIYGEPKLVKKEYVSLLSTDIKEIAKLDLESKLKSFFDSIENLAEKKTALRILELCKKLYPKDKLRNDGMSALSHPLTIAYWAMKAGADCTAILAALLHDTKEDGDINSKSEFENLLGSGCSPELIDSVWRKLSKMSNIRPKDEPVYDANEFLSKNLLSHEDIKKSEILRALDTVLSDYSNYILKVYHSNDYDVILLKELDALHNIRSAIYLDPKTDFAKIIRILLKLETHIDASKKICYDIARLQIIAARELLVKLESSGIDMSSDFFTNLHSTIWSHTYSISKNQRRVERRGVGATDLRAKLNIDTLPYRRTVPVLFHPEYRNWSEAISGQGDENRLELAIPKHCFPGMRIGLLKYLLLELGLMRGNRLIKRNFIDSKFFELDEQTVKRQMTSRFVKAGIGVVYGNSTLWPVFQGDVFIFRLLIPKHLSRKRDELRMALKDKSPTSETLTEDLSEDYASFIRKVEWITRRAFFSSLKKAIRMSNYDETIDSELDTSPLL